MSDIPARLNNNAAHRHIRVDRPFGDKELRCEREACWTWLGANLVGFNVEWVGCIITIKDSSAFGGVGVSRKQTNVVKEELLELLYINGLMSFSPIRLLSISEAY